MRNAGLDKAQAGIKIARRSINNLRFADDTTLKAKSEERLKNLLLKVKDEREKVALKLNILQVRLQNMWTKNFQMLKLDLEKAEEPEIKLPTSIGSLKKQERNILEPLTVWMRANCAKFL